MRLQDDAAKERMRANVELQQAKLALEKYGSDKFMRTFWRFIAMDVGMIALQIPNKSANLGESIRMR